MALKNAGHISGMSWGGGMPSKAGREGAGLVERRAYQTKPPRFEYLLTERGNALLPVLQEMCRWANTHIHDTWIPPDSFMQPLAFTAG